MIKIERRTAGEIAILDLSGKMVSDPDNLFWGHVADIVVENGGRQLLLNFSGIAECDSFGITELLRIHKSIENIGGRMYMCGVNELISKVFAITKVDTILHIAASEEEALAMLAPSPMIDPA